MPIDDLPGELTVPTRDGERDRWLRDYKFHDPSSDTTDGTQPFVDGSTVADGVMPLYHDIKMVADASDPEKIGGALLDTLAGADGVTRPPATGASGSVDAITSVGGATIFENDEIKASGLRYKCIATALYLNGQPVPIQGIDTGPATNLPPGTVMTWSNPRPGSANNATVTEQVNGDGLTGGRDQALDEEYRKLWKQAKRARAASGNDGQIQETVESTFGVAVEKAFTYPGILGFSTSCFVFTMKPQSVGATRIPNGTQILAALAWVRGQMPADEGLFGGTLIAEPIDVVLKVEWDPDGESWRDVAPWPFFYAATGQAIIVNSATSATNFILETFNGVYTAIPMPVAGQTIGFYDQPFAQFRRKKILSVTGTGPWTIVCDTTNLASDESYTPVVGQRAMPWSDSLQDLVTPQAAYFGTLGPGEQTPAFFSDFIQKRQPPSPRDWPHTITVKDIEGALDPVPSLFEAQIQEPALPLSPTVGAMGVDAYLLELGDISAFPI